MPRQNISSGRPWEESAGYSRAVRVGNIVDVCLTTPTAPDGTILHPGDVYKQTKLALEMVGEALAEAGATFNDVVKTRMFLLDMSKWEEAARAHAEVFRDIKPTTGWIGVSGFFTDGIVAEVEAMAVIED